VPILLGFSLKRKEGGLLETAVPMFPRSIHGNHGEARTSGNRAGCLWRSVKDNEIGEAGDETGKLNQGDEHLSHSTFTMCDRPYQNHNAVGAIITTHDRGVCSRPGVRRIDVFLFPSLAARNDISRT